MTDEDESLPTPATEPAPTDGRKRLWAALKKPPGRGQVAAGSLLAVLGFAAVVQVQSNAEDATYVGARQGELIALINNLSLASQRAENEIAQLAEIRSSLLNDAEATRTALERARQLADERGILAGTLPATGPGVRVTITDEDGSLGAANLINVIQELRDAGAEAIEFNDSVRVVAQTSVRDLEEGGVLIDGTTLEAPYVVEAIGSPPTLSGGLEIARGFAFEVRRLGGTVEIEQLDVVEITSVRELPEARYAEPDPSG